MTDTRFEVLRVRWSLGEKDGDWNAALENPETGRPFNDMTDQLDREAFSAAMMRDPRGLMFLQKSRAERARAIQHHFAVCADRLIDAIETKEGWPELTKKLADLSR